MTAPPRLWEVKHSYYGPCGSTHENHESWSAFVYEWGDADLDYNYLYRWDWREGPNYEVPAGQARLYLCFVQQRRDVLLSAHIDVTRADEPAIRAWLQQYWDHVRATWAPVSRPEAPHPSE